MELQFSPNIIIKGILEEAGVFGILAIGMMLVLVAVLLAMRARMAALVLLLASMCLSNLAGPVGLTATAIRWGTLLCMVPLGLPAVTKQGAAMISLYAYAFFSLLCFPRSPYAMWSLQRSIALIMLMIAVPGVLRVMFDKGFDPTKIFKWLIVIAGVWALINATALTGYITEKEAGRFEGGAISVGYSALVMGTLLPFTIWGTFNRWSVVFRVISAGIASMLSVLLVFGASRGGAFMGAIACIPLLLKLSVKRIVTGILVLTLIAGAVFVMFQQAGSQQQELILARFAGTGGTSTLSGRIDLWRTGLHRAVSSLLLGSGSGTGLVSKLGRQTGQGFHNAFITIWVEAGLFGLAAFVIALMITLKRGLAAMRATKTDPELQAIVRTTFGIALGIGALCMVESTITSATNMLIGAYLIVTVMIHEIWLRTRPEFVVQVEIPQLPAYGYGY